MIEQAINRYLALDPEAPARLVGFEGKVICLDIAGLSQQLYLLPHDGYIEVTTRYEQEPDATLRGTPIALFKMSMMNDVAPLLLRGEVEIIGDMRTGRAFKKLLSEIDIDWEEHLSTMTGDVVAHQLMSSLRAAAGWSRRTSESLSMDVSEYLQEESRDVVSGAEVRRFCTGVDELRSNVDRLEARLTERQEG